MSGSPIRRAFGSLRRRRRPVPKPCTYRLTRLEDGYQTGGLIAGYRPPSVDEESVSCVAPFPCSDTQRWDLTLEFCGSCHPVWDEFYGSAESAES